MSAEANYERRRLHHAKTLLAVNCKWNWNTKYMHQAHSGVFFKFFMYFMEGGIFFCSTQTAYTYELAAPVKLNYKRGVH